LECREWWKGEKNGVFFFDRSMKESDVEEGMPSGVSLVKLLLANSIYSARNIGLD